MQCNPISIRFNKMQYDAMKKTYDAMQFNMVQIVYFYFFGSDRQEIINGLKCLLTLPRVVICHIHVEAVVMREHNAMLTNYWLPSKL